MTRRTGADGTGSGEPPGEARRPRSVAIPWLRSAAALAAVLLLAGCAQRGSVRAPVDDPARVGGEPPPGGRCRRTPRWCCGWSTSAASCHRRCWRAGCPRERLRRRAGDRRGSGGGDLPGFRLAQRPGRGHRQGRRPGAGRPRPGRRGGGDRRPRHAAARRRPLDPVHPGHRRRHARPRGLRPDRDGRDAGRRAHAGAGGRPRGAAATCSPLVTGRGQHRGAPSPTPRRRSRRSSARGRRRRTTSRWAWPPSRCRGPDRRCPGRRSARSPTSAASRPPGTRPPR